MALKSGLAAQYGFAKEGTHGTFTTPTRFIDFVSESLTYNVSRVESKAIRAGQRIMRSDDWRPGKVAVEGSVELEVWNKSFGLLFDAMVGGTPATAGTGAVKTYTWSGPGDLPSLTVQVGVPDITGTVTPMTVLGAMVTEWELAAAVDEPVNLSVSFAGRDLVTSENLAAASYATGVELLTFVGASVTVSGNATPLTKVSIKGSNGLATERFKLGTNKRDQPLEAEQRVIEGELTGEFSGTTLFDLYRNGTEAAVVATFAGVTNPTHQVVVTLNVRFDGDTPQVGGTEVVEQPLKFKAVATGADSTAFTLAYSTTDTTI